MSVPERTSWDALSSAEAAEAAPLLALDAVGEDEGPDEPLSSPSSAVGEAAALSSSAAVLFAGWFAQCT